MLLFELPSCISMHVETGLTYNFISSFFSSFLFPLYFCLSYPYITLFPCLLLPLFSLFLSSFILSFCNYSLYIFFTFLSSFFVVCFCYLYSSTSFYFLLIFFHLFVYIYLPIISFFLSSDTLFLPSFINLFKPTDYLML